MTDDRIMQAAIKARVIFVASDWRYANIDGSLSVPTVDRLIDTITYLRDEALKDNTPVTSGRIQVEPDEFGADGYSILLCLDA